MTELGREILGEPPEEISFGYVDLKEFLETASITNLVPVTSAILLASSTELLTHLFEETFVLGNQVVMKSR
ncbi:MAG: hypothetical protein ABEI52_03185 [Halobacteriaceae archaeon]